MEHDLVWPNADSAANSDPWLIANHERIRLMQPRVLVVNFVHGLTEPEAREQVERLSTVLAESSRWQGFRDPAAPAFLDYRIVDIADLTEPRGTVDRNSARFPRTADGVGFDYGALHELRLYDGLRLDELAERGLINEVWLLADHTAHSAPWETVEVKRAYDADFRPLGFERAGGQLRRARRALDRPQPAHPVRQLRPRRGLRDGEPRPLARADGDLRRASVLRALLPRVRDARPRSALRAAVRVAVPVRSTRSTTRRPRACSTGRAGAGARCATTSSRAATSTSCPTAATTTTSTTAAPVLSTIETWRQPEQVARPWTPAVLERYRELAPDCMGRWVVYWRQNMPGLGNTALDDDGRPMKNWWPFLFY